MKKWITTIGFIVFLFGIVALFGFAQHRYNHRKINAVHIHFTNPELTFLDSKSVNNLLIQSYGNPLHQLNSTLNLHEIEDVLRQNDKVNLVSTFVEPDGRLQIQITQRKPLVRIKTAIKSYYLDTEGKPMPLSENYTERVPIATGIYHPSMEQELFMMMQQFAKDSLFAKQVVGLNRLSNGDYELIPRVGNYTITFGTPSDITHKMKKLKVFYKKMWNEPRLHNYKRVSLKYKNQVVCSY